MTRGPIVAAGAAAAALGIWLLLRPPCAEDPAARSPAAAAAARDGDAAEERRSTREDLRRVGSGLARLPARPAPAESAAASEQADPDALEAEPLAVRPRREPAEIAAALDDHAIRETDDPGWSRATEARIAEAFQAEVLRGSRLARAACRATLCRLEVEHDSVATQDRFLQDVRDVPPFDASAGVARRVESPGGVVGTVVYMAREGLPLRALRP